MSTVGATTGVRTVRAEERRAAKPNGWWGIATFVATEATLFGALIGSYFFLHFENKHWPAPGEPLPGLALPLILTAVLVLTSPVVQLAVRSARGGNRRGAWWLLALAFVVQAGYFAMQLHLFLHDAAKLHPQHDAYASIYETLVGADHAHVGFGLLLDVFVLARLAAGLTAYRLTGLRVAAFYWHFVNAVSVAVVLTQISPRL